MYRPKPCMKCGGKLPIYQSAGTVTVDPFTGQVVQQMAPSQTSSVWSQPQAGTPVNPIVGTAAAEMYRIHDQPGERNSFDVVTPEQKQKFNPYFAMRTATVGLSELAGRVDRKRQDKYFQQQMTNTLMNPMDVWNFQPTNAYDAYRKYGGTLSKYQSGGSTVKPAFPSADERDAWRTLLTKNTEAALKPGADRDVLLETSYHKIDDGNNCINCVGGMYRKSGKFSYSNPVDGDRYLSNTAFEKAVHEGKEDFYQISGNFQVGDQLQYISREHKYKDPTTGKEYTQKNVPGHSKYIYKISEDDEGNKRYHVAHNGGSDTMIENVYTEQEMRDMTSGKYFDNNITLPNIRNVNIYRPGLSLDREALEKERQNRTATPEGLKALEDRSAMIDWQVQNDPAYTYGIRSDSKYAGKVPEGMQKFFEFANNKGNIDKLVKTLGVEKSIIHDELLNTFGEMGQENKWKDRVFGGDLASGKLPVKIPLENTVERVGSWFNLGKGKSVGPGQLKLEAIPDHIKKAYGIKKVKDLYDFDKVIPAMTAMNVANRKWMENRGEKLSENLVGKEGVSSDMLKYGEGRWTPYFYRGNVNFANKFRKEAVKALGEGATEEQIKEYIGKLSGDNLKTFDKDSYAMAVYRNWADNLERTAPFVNPDIEDYRELQPVTIKAEKKKPANLRAAIGKGKLKYGGFTKYGR